MSGTIVDLGRRVVLRLSGPASLKFLHDVSAQDVASLEPGRSAVAAFLDDKGRVLADARVTATEEGAVVDAVPATSAGLERAVVRVAPLAGVEVEREDCEALRLTGAEAPSDQLEPLGIVAVEAGWGGTGVDLLAPSLEIAKMTLLQGGAAEAPPALAERERIAAGRPLYGVDLDDSTLVNETPLVVHAVSFTKGCYPGQESVARVHNLGQPKGKLRVLALDGGVRAGDPVLVDGAEVGRVTSATDGYAFARVRSDVEPGVLVTVGTVKAEVTDAGWSRS